MSAARPDRADRLLDLRRVAQAADHGGRGWHWKGGYPQHVHRDGDVVLVAETYTDPDFPADFAPFIATFDPPTVLALIDALLAEPAERPQDAPTREEQ